MDVIIAEIRVKKGILKSCSVSERSLKGRKEKVIRDKDIMLAVSTIISYLVVLKLLLFMETEKARLLAEAKAAEDARRQAEAQAAAEAKRQRELEREAARQALLKASC